MLCFEKKTQIEEKMNKILKIDRLANFIFLMWSREQTSTSLKNIFKRSVVQYNLQFAHVSSDFEKHRSKAISQESRSIKINNITSTMETTFASNDKLMNGEFHENAKMSHFYNLSFSVCEKKCFINSHTSHRMKRSTECECNEFECRGLERMHFTFQLENLDVTIIAHLT